MLDMTIISGCIVELDFQTVLYALQPGYATVTFVALN